MAARCVDRHRCAAESAGRNWRGALLLRPGIIDQFKAECRSCAFLCALPLQLPAVCCACIFAKRLGLSQHTASHWHGHAPGSRKQAALPACMQQKGRALSSSAAGLPTCQKRDEGQITAPPHCRQHFHHTGRTRVACVPLASVGRSSARARSPYCRAPLTAPDLLTSKHKDAGERRLQRAAGSRPACWPASRGGPRRLHAWRSRPNTHQLTGSQQRRRQLPLHRSQAARWRRRAVAAGAAAAAAGRASAGAGSLLAGAWLVCKGTH